MRQNEESAAASDSLMFSKPARLQMLLAVDQRIAHPSARRGLASYFATQETRPHGRLPTEVEEGDPPESRNAMERATPLLPSLP
jgi:hypothetical protein